MIVVWNMKRRKDLAEVANLISERPPPGAACPRERLQTSKMSAHQPEIAGKFRLWGTAVNWSIWKKPQSTNHGLPLETLSTISDTFHADHFSE